MHPADALMPEITVSRVTEIWQSFSKLIKNVDNYAEDPGLNARDFLDVKAICDAGSLRRAAAALGISQPTLSNRIGHLESKLGALLFKRRRGQSQPTELALFIASRASTMAEEAARIAREIKRLASGRTGVVRVGLVAAPTGSVTYDDRTMTADEAVRADIGRFIDETQLGSGKPPARRAQLQDVVAGLLGA